MRPLASISVFIISSLLACVTFASTISVDIDKNVNLALGQRNFGPINIPNDVMVCTLSFDRNQWIDKTATLTTQLFISVDGGPFEFWIGMASEGGSDAGAVTGMTRRLPAGLNRKVQGNYVVSGARFRSTVSVRCA